MSLKPSDNPLELLRRYEPILRFTKGEYFFPCAVDGYIKQCSLWQRIKDAPDKLLVPWGELTPAKLIEVSQQNDSPTLYMRFVEEPLDSLEFQRWVRRKDRPRFRAPGRLARVGLVTRLVDIGFDLSLLLRGSVPGGTVAAAETQYRAMVAEDNRYVYYGRVVEENGYIILHYFYFYAMNNWRTTFYGMNDHESDWEQVMVYLVADTLQPQWVAYAAHEHAGDELRRRWDDPELHRSGNHPIVYAGAGSHASYFQPGEYLGSIQVGFARPILAVVNQALKLWADRFGQGRMSQAESDFLKHLFSLPFIDYARGDGRSVGPNQTWAWSPIVISDEVEWVDQYRGLWGLDIRDPFKGEQAPAGPKYNRDGSVRATWFNPLGWAGLHKVVPPQKAPQALAERIDQLRSELNNVEAEITLLNDRLPKLQLEVMALDRHESLNEVWRLQEKRLQETETALNILYERQAVLHDTLKACERYLLDLQQGKIEPPQAHLHQKRVPQTPSDIEKNTLLESWAALSAGLLLLAFSMLVLLSPTSWIWGLGGLVVMYAFIEAALRRRLQDLLLSISVILAVLSALVLIYEFFWELVLLNLLIIALLIIVTNWRELRGT